MDASHWSQKLYCGYQNSRDELLSTMFSNITDLLALL